MAPATIQSSVSEHDISAAATILRNDDPLSQALRDGITLDVDEIAYLSRTIPPSLDQLSSVGSSSTMVFSSRGESTITKPTSADTDHQTTTQKDKGKHKMKKGYTSSLSVTYGSASEAEVERRALCKNTLIALGDWADTELEHVQPLKGMVRARDRQQSRRKLKQKKPIVVIEQNGRAQLAGRARGWSEERGLMLMTTPSYGSTDIKHLRHGALKDNDDVIRLAEEGQSNVNTTQCVEPQSLSRARAYMLLGIVSLKVFTIVLSAYGAYVTGRTRMACTKGIVFAATAFMSIFTVLAMLIARRALSEALLAGLIESVFGFALVVELDDFM